MAVSKPLPWSYRKGTTALHRLKAGIKLTFLLLLSLAAFLPNLMVLSTIALVLIVLSLTARIGPWELLRGSGPLLFVVLGVFILGGVETSPPYFSFDGLGESVIFCGRIAIAFAAGALLFAVTTQGEIRRALSRLEAALRIEKFRISLGISLMLGFLPLFFQMWEDVNLAWQSKGGKKGLKGMTILIPLVIERMIIKAAETALAMESRGAAPYIE